MSKALVADAPASYSSAPTAAIRKALGSGEYQNVKIGDVKKAVKKIYELSENPQPPLRAILGKDAVEALRQQLELPLEVMG